MIDFRRAGIAVLIALAASAAAAQEHAGHPPGAHAEHGRPEGIGPGVLALLPPDAVTEHSIDTPAGPLAYTATAGTFSLFDQSGERSAAIFYTAYVAKSNDPRAGRSPSSSTAVPAPARLFSISAWSVRASPRSARTAATAPRCASSTIRTPGSPSPIWC